MPIRNGGYIPRTDEEIRQSSSEFLLDQAPNANPYATSTYTYALLYAHSQTIAQNQEQSLQNVYNAAYVEDASDEQLTKKARNLGVIRREAITATGWVEFTRDNPPTTDTVIPSGTVVETVEPDPIQFETTETTTIETAHEYIDSTEYTTTNTSATTVRSKTIDLSYRDSVDVQAELKTSNSSYTAYLDVVDVTNGTTIDTYTTTATSYGVVGPTTYDTSSLSGDVTIEFQLSIGNSSGTAYTHNTEVDVVGQTGTQANIVALEAGSHGNVGANAIGAIPSPPIDMSVTNPVPTGDPSYNDTDGDPLRTGRDRENDDNLRQRVLDREATNEGPSSEGIELALDDVDDVISTHVNTNQTPSTSNGLDPYQTEVVAYGGDLYEIAKTLYDSMSITSILRLVGGINGTEESTTVYSSLLDQDITVPISRPTMTTVDIELDVVHTSTYDGDVVVKDAIVEYIGGTYADDSVVVGLGLGENILINEIENHAEDVQGVEYVDVTLIDSNGDGTDDRTTDSDGVPVLSISNSEVPRVDADDIVLSTTQR